jgi:hypothetical protein
MFSLLPGDWPPNTRPGAIAVERAARAAVEANSLRVRVGLKGSVMGLLSVPHPTGTMTPRSMPQRRHSLLARPAGTRPSPPCTVSLDVCEPATAPILIRHRRRPVMNGRLSVTRPCSVLACAVVLGVTACSGGRGAKNPVTPSPGTASVAGTWVGTITYSAGTVTGQENFQMLLIQTDGTAAVTGSYQAERFSGNIRGQATANPSAPRSISPRRLRPSLVPDVRCERRCRRHDDDVDEPTVTALAPCTDPPVNLTITVQKR